MTSIAQSYWQAELSRRAEGIILFSLLRNYGPVPIAIEITLRFIPVIKTNGGMFHE